MTYGATWGSDFTADLALEGGFVFRLRPPFEMSIEPKTGTASGAFRFIVNRNQTARPFTVIGGNDLIRLTAEDTGIGVGIVIGASTATGVEIDPRAFSDIKGLVLKLGSEGSDNFLASLLAGAEIEGRFDLGLEYRLREGLVVKAAGGLEIAIPMHQSLGFVDVRDAVPHPRDQRRRLVDARDVRGDHRGSSARSPRPSSGWAHASSILSFVARRRQRRSARST